ncbi:MAG: GAF domain-containing protein [Myxococcota bacterium]
MRALEDGRNSLDVLGPRPERRRAFTRELLAESDDVVLQQIVHQAASELSAPIALVTLVLDQIQFFKAHFGLPPDLAASRGTARDVSFCQFVVRDGEAFEVTDALIDGRVPQHLVTQYDIRAYLGVPVRADNIVVGSLCVIDTKARDFTDEERHRLAKLAELVDERLAAISEHRRHVRLNLSERAAIPALAELRDRFETMEESVEMALPAMVAIRSFLRFAAHAREAGTMRIEEPSLRAAERAADAGEDALHDIEVAAADCRDSLVALERLMIPSPSARLSNVLTAAQDLARPVTRTVGDAPLPDLSFDPVVYTPRPLAVAILTTALTATASRLARLKTTSGLRLELTQKPETAELSISADGMTDEIAEEVGTELNQQLGRDPSLSIGARDGSIRLTFAVAKT